MMTVLDFQKMKKEKLKISMVTCYDFWSAQILNDSKIDCLLVGDSLAMVMHGHSSTVAATTEMMVPHVMAVAKGAPDKFIIADMPFLTFRKGIAPALDCVGALMKAGAHAVKLEGVAGHEEVVRQIVDSGVPVMGHLGLTPQSINGFGGFKVQARDIESANELREHAQTLQKLGCFSLVLECVPRELAAQVSVELNIPTIGIGAGSETDGQVLVLHDLLGLNQNFKPKFLRHFLNGYESVIGAVDQFTSEVRESTYPREVESYK
jgi:3-methyl-2-oxobutanoate hydroxymethyltransferase